MPLYEKELFSYLDGVRDELIKDLLQDLVQSQGRASCSRLQGSVPRSWRVAELHDFSMACPLHA